MKAILYALILLYVVMAIVKLAPITESTITSMGNHNAIVNSAIDME